MQVRQAAHISPDSPTAFNPTDGRTCPVCTVIDCWSVRRLEGVLGSVPDILVSECSGCGIARTAFDLSESDLERYCARFMAMIDRGYEERQEHTARRVFAERADALADLAPSRLLDVGSERGYFLATMRDRGWIVQGVEPYVPFAQFASATLGVPVCTTTLEAATFDEKFDVITMWHVLEHLDDPHAVLRQCYSLLRPGGTLFFEVPNIDSVGALLCGGYWLGYRNPTHRWGFRPRSVLNMARTAGYSDVIVKPSWTAAGWYGIKRSLKNVVTRSDYWQDRVEGRPTRVPLWRRGLAAVIGFYPVPVMMSLFGGWTNRGEVLRVWCRRPDVSS